MKLVVLEVHPAEFPGGGFRGKGIGLSGGEGLESRPIAPAAAVEALGFYPECIR